MIFVYKDRIIQIEWSIFRGTSQVPEDFSRALVKLFLVCNYEKYAVPVTAEGGMLVAQLPQDLPDGAYSLEAIWVKNYNNLFPVKGTDTPSVGAKNIRYPGTCHNAYGMLHPWDHRSNDRCLMRSRKDYVFAVTSYQGEETAVNEDGSVTIRISSAVATYGYDGLSAYELAVMRDDFNGTEGEWLEQLKFELEIAQEHKLGGITAVTKTDSETEEVKVDPKTGRLYVKPGESELSVATETKLGGIKASSKTDNETVEAKIGNDGKLYVPKVGEELKTATETTLGGIKAAAKTDDETVEVKIDSNSGKLYTKSGNNPDDEDLHLVEQEDKQVLQFADKEYNSESFSGLGRVYLRKNISGGKNVLTQEMMSKANTRYIIQYDYDLNGETITVPEGCTLDFQGGKLVNGKIISNGNTDIVANLEEIFSPNLELNGNWKQAGHIRWFGANDSLDDNSDAIQRCLDAFTTTIIDKGKYNVKKTLTVTKSDTILGGDNLYGENYLLFYPENDDVTTLFVLNNTNDQPYIRLRSIRLSGSGAATVDDAYWKAGTIAIDITSGNTINLSKVFITGFETGIASRVNSYYNEIDCCRFSYLKRCLYNFSPNNLRITNTRVSYFSTFIEQLSGDGPLTIDKCSFEIFSAYIMNTWQKCDKLNFTNNYVEVQDRTLPPLYIDNNNGKYGGNVLFNGCVTDFFSCGNEFQVNTARKVYSINMAGVFTSINNKILISSNSCNLSHYLELRKEENEAFPTRSVQSVTLKDSCRTFEAPSVVYTTEYNSMYRVQGTKTLKVDGYDPISLRSIVPYVYGNIQTSQTDGYEFDNSKPPSYIVNDNIMYLQGHLIRHAETVEPTGTVGTLLSVPEIGSAGSSQLTVYVQAMDDENYERVVLQYEYATKQLTFISGDNTKGIILDGSYIPFRR